MKGSTHLAAGVITGLFLAIHTHAEPALTSTLIAGASLGSLLPDIDNCQSAIGNKIKPVSFLTQILIGHRTVFHAPVLYIILYIMFTQTAPALIPIINGIAIGIASHLFLDMLNPAGIPLLWPISKRYRILSIRSGGLIDRLLAFVLWLFVLFLVILAYS